MKYLILFFSLYIPLSTANGQNLFTSRTGHIWFLAPTSVEDVDAHSHEASARYDDKTGELIVTVPIQSFRFPTALMKRHFNKMYMESDRFPESTLIGKVANFRSIPLRKPGTYAAKINGVLTIHGVKKNLTADCKITVQEGGHVIATAEFSVLAEDFGIELPLVLGNDPIKVNVEIALDPSP